MNNWNWPQWIMLGMIPFQFTAGCMRMTQSKEKYLIQAAKQREDAEFNLVIHTLVNIFECYVLAKGGFW